MNNATAMNQSVAAIVDNAAVNPASGIELFSVVDLLETNSQLRRFLVNPAGGSQARQGVVEGIFSTQINASSLQIIQAVVDLDVKTTDELISNLEDAALRATLRAVNNLDEIRDGLFRFGQIVRATPDLRVALANQSVSVNARRELVSNILSGQVDSITLLLAQRCVRHIKFEKAIDRTLAVAADITNHELATVIAAKALNPDQVNKIKIELTRIYRKPIDLQIVIKPEILGGVRIEIGDDVIDGTIASRVEQARRQLESFEN